MIKAIAVGFLFASLTRAQPPLVVLLTNPVTASEEFSRVGSSRELADGRLLVTDQRDNRIALVSFDGTPAQTLSRVGSGPGEYRRTGPLVAMPGDSTALVDGPNGRLLLFSGGKVAGTIVLADQATRLSEIPVGISAAHFYAYSFPVDRRGAADTLALVRVSRRNRAIDTIARMAAQTARLSAPKRNGSITTVHITVSPWSAGDQAVLFEDAWLAVARVAPYAVDWITPNGKLQRGKPIRAEDPPFSDAEKRAFLARLSEGTGRPAASIDSRSDWPEVVTAFTSDSRIIGAPAPALLTSPRGQLLIRRQPTAAEPPQRYDIVDRSGRVVGQVVLGRGETLIGAGRAHLYSVVTDDDGIQRVRRYDWPES
jgi:hypothetical protein